VTGSAHALRPAWLLIRLRLRRALNQMGAMWRYRIGSPERKATSRTSPVASLLGALVGLSMLAGFTFMAQQMVANIELRLGSVQVEARRAPPDAASGPSRPSEGRARPARVRLPAAPGSVWPLPVLRALAFEMTLILLAALSIMLAGRDLLRPEWDLEWLATLPLPLPTLLVCRLIERVATSGSGWLGLAPVLSVLAWNCGYRWAAPLLGIGLSLTLLLALATVQLVVDTGLRLSLTPPKLRNLHAVISVLSVPLPFGAMAMAMQDSGFLFDWAAALPQWAMWLPPGLAVQTLAAADGAAALGWYAVLLGEILLVVVAGLALLQRQLRHGVVAAGSREVVLRAPRQARAPDHAHRAGHAILSPVQRRELRLLARDRTYLVQTLIFPALIVGMQVFFNPGAGASLGLINDSVHLAAIAFALSAYGLMFSAFQTLNAEGQALWILYTVPHTLEQVLWQKARLWATIALIYPLVLFAVVVVTGTVSLQFAAAALIALCGVPIYAVIATALGVFGCDPLELEVARRIKPTYLNLYVMLAFLYVYAIYISSIAAKAAIVVLTALVAIALWQKARDHFDYLLDPSAAPPPRVSAADGLMAALLFFVLQGMAGIGLMLANRSRVLTAEMVWIAFCIAGALTYGLMRLIYWRMRTADVPRLLADGWHSALLLGAIAGLAASLVAIVYLYVAPGPLQAPRPGKAADLGLGGLAVIAILAAPVFEEFIFRGLIFKGLRRSLGLLTATLASAAIFAIVHPVYAMVPVFALGVLAALVYERTRMLAAPMAVHAVYNAVIVGWQWNAIYG
jgi:membrane protease YdiL (CAAX protease family)